MSFSRIPSEAKTELEVILDIADKFSVIMDQKKLKDAVKTAYGLTEDEQKASETVRKDIKTYKDLLVENQKKLDEFDLVTKTAADYQEKRLAEINKAAEALDNKQAKLDDASIALSEDKKQIAAQKAELTKALAEIESEKKDIQAIRQDITVQLARLAEESAAIAKQKESLAESELLLKTKIFQVQKLTEGI